LPLPKNLLVLCEDDAYLAFFHGFRKHFSINSGIIKELPIAGGWEKGVDKLKDPKSTARMMLKKYTTSYILLLIDSDMQVNRIDEIMNSSDLACIKDRLFILSAIEEAEPLNKKLGGGLKEAAGGRLAESCHAQDCKLWKDTLDLHHNLPQIQRIRDKLPELFQ